MLCPERVAFSKNLRRLREQRGMSINELHKLSEMSRGYISAVEKLEANISLDNMSKLAKVLGASVIDMLQAGEEEGVTPVNKIRTNLAENLKAKRKARQWTVSDLSERSGIDIDLEK